MEEDGETYVLLIVNDEETDTKEELLIDNLEPEIRDLIETAQKHDQSILVEVKEEPEDTYEEHNSDYIDDDLLATCDTKEGIQFQTYIPDENLIDYIKPEIEDLLQHLKKQTNRKLSKTHKRLKGPNDYKGLPMEDVKYLVEIERRVHSNKGPKKYLNREYKSLVDELRQEYEELRNDEALLVNTVEQIMRDVKPPDPPRDYFIINGIMYECVECGNFSSTLPATSRHYNEKHGPRYLICYACGDDFRSSINLYKHEMRCRAPDAHIVLKARAGIVGSKGRGRPFLERAKDKPYCFPNSDSTPVKQENKQPVEPAVKDEARRALVYPCSLCSAVYTSKSNMQAHENMHRGERPYRCRSCPRAYTNKSALQCHAKIHTEEIFICDYCNRSFKSKPLLKSHLNTHQPVRKHGCPECGRRYAQRSALKIHINRVHRKLPPPCACELCPKRYPRMSLLKGHMQKAHGLTIMTRNMFYKMLPSMTETELKRHLIVNAEC